MKLHLPKGLRTALLAVMTAVAAFPTTVQAASSAPAVFKDFNVFKDEDWASYEKGTNTMLENNKPSDGLQLTYMPDANKQDWILTIDAYNYRPVFDDEGDALGGNIFGTIGAEVDYETGEVTLRGKNALAIHITGDGDLRISTTMDETDRLRNDLIIGQVGRDWVNDTFDADVSVRLILGWDADGGQPRHVESGKYGALTLMGAYILSNESDHAILHEIKSDFTNKVLIDNYDLPENLFGWGEGERPAYAVAGSGQVKVSLRSEGLGRLNPWVGNATWMITGETSINGLIAGEYRDENKGVNRALGNVTYVNPDNPNNDYETVTDTITFTGTKGALVLTDTIDGKTEYQLTNSHPIGFDIDPKGTEHEVVAGFGADSGLTLRVDIDVMETTALSAEGCGLRIVGTGTTILEVDNTGLERIGATLNEVEAYLQPGGGPDLEAYLKNMGYETAGLRFEQVKNADDPQNTQGRYWFAFRDREEDRSITFADVAANSEVVLAPKGNGNIILNLHTSKIHESSHIRMRDESGKETITTEKDVVWQVPQLDYATENSPNTPMFDDLGVPQFELDPETQLPVVSYQYKTTGNTATTVPWEDGLHHYYEIKKLADGTIIAYEYTTTGENGEGKAAYHWNDQIGSFAEVTSAGYGEVLYTIPLATKPNMVNQIQAIVTRNDDGNVIGVVKDNGIVKTTNVMGKEYGSSEVWLTGGHDHSSIEKYVGTKYSPIATPVTEHVVARPIAGTDMYLKLWSSAVDASSATGGHFENEIAGGDIVIDGRKLIYDEDKIGSEVAVGGHMSYLEVSSLTANRSVIVDSHLKVNGEINASTVEIQSGTTEAEKVTVTTGNVYVSAPTFINHESDRRSATLVVSDKLTVLQNASVDTEGHGWQHLYVYGGAVINELECDNTVFVGTDREGLDRTPESWLTVNKAVTPEIRAPWMAIYSNDGTKQEIISGETSIYYDVVSEVEGSERTDITGSGLHIIRSAAIAGNTTIELRTDDTVLYANAVGGTNVYLANRRTSPDAGALITNLRHEKLASSQNATISISYSGTVATGKLSADEFIMPSGYSLSAAELEVSGLLYVPAGTLQDSSSGVPATFALARNATPVHTEYRGVNMKNVSVDAAVTSATEITADSIVLGKGHSLIGLDAVSGVKVSTTNGLEASDNTALYNVTLVSGDLITQNDVTISNMKMEDGKFKSNGTTYIYNMSLSNMKTFGGEDGQAFTPVSGENQQANVTFDGTLLNNAQSGTTLDLHKIAIDARGHDFDSDGSEIEVISASDGNAISVAHLSSVSYKVQSYTYADHDIKDNTLYLVGDKDEERAWREMADTEIREEIHEAIDEARALTPGGELAALYDSLGMVMETSIEQRQEILDSIAGASITALADSQRRGVQDMQNNLRNRIIQMGGNPDWEGAGLQAWAQADGSFSTTDGGEDGPGYDYNTWGATVGANIDLSASVTAGMSFSASYGEIESDYADRAKGNNDAYYVSFFARHQTGRWTQMLILSAGKNEMDLERSVGAYKAEGQTEGSTLSAYYELGYTLGLNDDFTHIIQPMVSARITSAKIDEYTETGSIGNAALTYDGASCTYGSVGIGLRYQGVIYESVYERNGVLEIRAMVSSDFGDATDTAELALGQGKVREVEGTDTTGTGFDLGVGLSIPVEVQTTVFADMDISVRPDYTGVRANIGMRYDF